MPDPTRPYQDRGWGGPDERQPRPWYDGPPPPARAPAPEPWNAWPPPAPAAAGPSAPATRPLVEVEHLTKVYEPSPPWMKVLLRSSISEPVTAVADLSLEVWPGQVFAVVGPNGAGKSTLFRVLTGLITPTAGRVTLAGIDVVGDARSARRHIGFMPAEDRSLNLRHTCWQNLAFHGRLQGIPRHKLDPRIDEVLEIVGLGHVPDRTGHALSSGMRARLQLARALLHEPDILVLDEPTGTIDPVGAHDLLQLIRRLADERRLAVLLSSHRLEEIDALEDNVLFINKGEVVHTGSMDSLRAVMEQPILRLRFDSPASARQACEHLSAGRDLQVSVDGDELHVAGNPTPGEVLSRLGSHLARVEAVDRSRIPLQELITRLVRGGAPKPAKAPRRPAGGVPPPGPLPRRVPPATNGTPSWRGASWRPSGPPASPGGRANGAPNRTSNGAATNGATPNGSPADRAWDNGASGYGSWGNGSSGNGSWGNGSSGNGSGHW